MKQHLLSDSDRAALQSMVPLASALGAGTIFALFFGGRRRAGFAVFEVFAIVAVLVAVGSTAYFCIALMHRNEAISDSDLTHVATPLVVAAFLLVFISIFSRLPGPWERALTVAPLVIGAALVAVEVVTNSTWSSDTGHASLLALLILLLGAILGFLSSWVDRADRGWERRNGYRRLARLAGAGYAPERRPLALELPGKEGAGSQPVGCWRRKDRVFLDAAMLRSLREQANEHWAAFAAGQALAPESAALVGVKVGAALPGRGGARRATVTTATGAESDEHRLEANEDGLFDVTGLGLL